MSNEFEKFIRKNRSDFDDAMPSGDVWLNIEKNIPAKQAAKRFTIRDIYKWSAAAAIFFVALTSVYFLFVKKYSHETPTADIRPTQGREIIANANPEYAAEFEQASLAVEQRQEELKAAVANHPELYKKFQDDLNILDSSYKMLRNQVAQSVNRDVIIKAMIQNLQLQSELLGRQLMIINEFKTTKTSKDEKSI